MTDTVDEAARIIDPMAFSLKPEHYGTDTLPAWPAGMQEVARCKARKVLALTAIQRRRIELVREMAEDNAKLRARVAELEAALARRCEPHGEWI